MFKLKKAEKTKNRIGTASVSLHIIVILGAILIFIAPLVHIDFPITNSKVEAFKKSKKIIFEDFRRQKEEIRKNYNKGLITGEEKIAQDDLLTEKENTFLMQYQKELKTVIDKNRIFGWKTWKKFLIGFGVRLPYLFFTLMIVFFIQKLDTKDKYLKRTFTFTTIALFTTSFYQLIWVFWDKQDFPKGYYYVTALALGFIASLIAVSFLKYRKSLELKFKGVINQLIVFIINSDKYIDGEDLKTQYFKGYMKEFEKISE